MEGAGPDVAGARRAAEELARAAGLQGGAPEGGPLADGLVPGALLSFMRGVGCTQAGAAEAAVAAAVAQCGAAAAADLRHARHVAAGLREMGLVEDEVRSGGPEEEHRVVHGCPGCGLRVSKLAVVGAGDELGVEELKLLERVTEAQRQRLWEAAGEPAAVEIGGVLRAAWERHGVAVCLRCATGALTERRLGRVAAGGRGAGGGASGGGRGGWGKCGGGTAARGPAQWAAGGAAAG